MWSLSSNCIPLLLLTYSVSQVHKSISLKIDPMLNKYQPCGCGGSSSYWCTGSQLTGDAPPNFVIQHLIKVIIIIIGIKHTGTSSIGSD